MTKAAYIMEKLSKTLTNSQPEKYIASSTPQGHKYDVVMSIPAEQVGGKEGEKRYYQGSGIHRKRHKARQRALFNTRKLIATSPEDSLTSDKWKPLLNK